MFVHWRQVYGWIASKKTRIYLWRLRTVTKHCERIQKFRETGNLKHIHKKELDKACFVHDTPYSDSKDLAKRAISDKILKERVHEITINSKYHRHQIASASMVYKIFDKKTGSGSSVNEELTQESHKTSV